MNTYAVKFSVFLTTCSSFSHSLENLRRFFLKQIAIVRILALPNFYRATVIKALFCAYLCVHLFISFLFDISFIFFSWNILLQWYQVRQKMWQSSLRPHELWISHGQLVSMTTVIFLTTLWRSVQIIRHLERLHAKGCQVVAVWYPAAPSKEFSLKAFILEGHITSGCLQLTKLVPVLLAQ